VRRILNSPCTANGSSINVVNSGVAWLNFIALSIKRAAQFCAFSSRCICVRGCRCNAPALVNLPYWSKSSRPYLVHAESYYRFTIVCIQGMVGLHPYFMSRPARFPSRLVFMVKYIIIRCVPFALSRRPWRVACIALLFNVACVNKLRLCLMTVGE